MHGMLGLSGTGGRWSGMDCVAVCEACMSRSILLHLSFTMVLGIGMLIFLVI